MINQLKDGVNKGCLHEQPSLLFDSVKARL